MIPHSHDDLGWLKSVEEYYYGLRSDIYFANVTMILDSVLKELKNNNERTFCYTEMKYFSMWYYK